MGGAPRGVWCPHARPIVDMFIDLEPRGRDITVGNEVIYIALAWILNDDQDAFAKLTLMRECYLLSGLMVRSTI